MSASSGSMKGVAHTVDAVSSWSETPIPVSGASESTPLVPLGRILSDIINIRIKIEIVLATIPRNAPNKQELAAAVRECITECQELLANVTEVASVTKAHAEALYRLLQVMHSHLQDRQVYGKRAQLMGIAKAFSSRPASPSPMYHAQLQEAFDALKNSLSHPVMMASQSTTAGANSQNNAVQSSVAPEAPHKLAATGPVPALLASVTPPLQNSIPTSITLALPTNKIHSHSTPAAAEANRPDTMTEFVATRPAAPERALPVNESLPMRPAEKTGLKHCATTAPKKNPMWGTVVDTVDGGLRLLSTLTDFIPDPAGPIVKLMAGTGLTIIEMLQGMADNLEEAESLGRYIGALIQTVGRFLEPPDDETPDSCDAETTKHLQLFLDVLEELTRNLVELKRQGRFKQGVSHKTNADDMKKWETGISRAFATLQAQLSLDSIRLLTKMNAADACQERDRLIGLLGDGDIGATEKSPNAADLMCLPGTRTEVLDQVDQWITNPCGSRILWISGVAGCGKSAVAATIAGRPRSISTSIAVFYFARGNQERNKRVLCSLSRQLAQFGHGSLEQFVLSGVNTKPDIATSHLDIQFQHIIVDPLKKLVPGSPPVLLVVDALDEWNNYEAVTTLVELIKDANTELPPTVRFVLASRNEPHLVRSLGSDMMSSLVTRYPLDAVVRTDAGRDIRRYIEKRFVKIRAQSGIDASAWPKAEDIDSLVLLSDGLFQWAATVMSYIGAMGSQGRLRNILKTPERYRGLDNLYQGVLEMSSREEMDERVPRLLQDVLGAILTAPSPRDATTIGYLCCDNLDTLDETMELMQDEVLPRLASMFIIPKALTRPITVSHKSVLDYLTSKDRCANIRFYIDLTAHQERIIHSCFRKMDSKLRRDICSINDPSKLNRDVQPQIAAHIPPALRYLCGHWAEYLASTGEDGFAASRDCLEQFSRNHLLHWIEVMGLIGLTERVVSIARDVETWLLKACPSPSPADELTRQLWSDAQRFVAMFSDLISTAVPHIYISALRLAPSDTRLVQQYGKTSDRGVRVTGGLLGKQWPPPAWIGRGHSEGVKCASFSPNGRTILSGSDDQTLRIWDAESGAQKGEPFNGHTNAVKCASFSPDGQTILSGSEDQTLRTWDAESGDRRGEMLKGQTGYVRCASFSPDGTTILFGSYGKTLQLWDVESGAQRGRTLEGHTDVVLCALFSPDGKKILSGSEDHTLRLWDAESGAQIGKTLEGHIGAVQCASFSADEKTILSGSFDGTLRFWDAESGTQKGGTLMYHEEAVSCASISPDGKTILSGSWNQTLRLWDAESGAPKGRTLSGHIDNVRCASFSADGRTILSASRDNTVRTWDADSGALRAEPQNGHTRGVSCFVFSPDGGTIISGSYDETVRLWDAETGALKGEPIRAEGMVSELAFSADGLTLIGTMYDGSSQKWDLVEYVHPDADPLRHTPVFKGSVSPEGWVFHRDIRWFWMPFYYADWLLFRNRLAVCNERVVYIIDVSEIMYIVE